MSLDDAKKILVVGAGFAGCVFARLAAEDGFLVHIIEKKNHIGGLSYSYEDEATGVETHKYGPHIFHTSNDDVYRFICRFTKFLPYIHRVKCISNKTVYSLPINLFTINQFFGKTFTPNEAIQFIKTIRIKIDKVTNFKEYILNALGMDLYEAFFKNYTIKQWGVDPSDIPISTAKRLPIRFNYNDEYFDDKYQGIPVDGYGQLFKNLVNHENINVELNCPFSEFKNFWMSKYNYLVYSGSIDEYYSYIYGELPYRSIFFEKIITSEYQGTSVINYCDLSPKYTRIHEHKYFIPYKKYKQSLAFIEYSDFGTSKQSPFYPINSPSSQELYKKYKTLTEQNSNVIIVGRLGCFKYYNMDESIANSIFKYQEFKRQFT